MSLLVIALVLFLVFGGLGFVAHVLWLGLLIALAVGVFHMISGKSHSKV